MAQKSSQYLFVNAVNLVSFAVLALTGIVNLILPRGHEMDGFLVSLRHFMRDTHEWAGIIFMVFGIIHIIILWTYIKKNLVKYGIMKEKLNQ